MSKEILQVTGEVCESCKPRWEERDMPFQVLVAGPESTNVHHEKIVFCSYCDGPALELAIKNSVPKKKKK